MHFSFYDKKITDPRFKSRFKLQQDPDSDPYQTIGIRNTSKMENA